LSDPLLKKNTLQKRPDGVAYNVYPKFKPQFQKKKERKSCGILKMSILNNNCEKSNFELLYVNLFYLTLSLVYHVLLAKILLICFLLYSFLQQILKADDY
jgi:hypothetical protein